MAVLLMSLGGKGVKILVNAEDTPVSVKLKASKKFGWYPFTTPICFDFSLFGIFLLCLCFLLSSWLLIHVLCNLSPQKERQMVISSSLISFLTALAFCRIEAFREDQIVLFWERASGWHLVSNAKCATKLHCACCSHWSVSMAKSTEITWWGQASTPSWGFQEKNWLVYQGWTCFFNGVSTIYSLLFFLEVLISMNLNVCDFV